MTVACTRSPSRRSTVNRCETIARELLDSVTVLLGPRSGVPPRPWITTAPDQPDTATPRRPVVVDAAERVQSTGVNHRYGAPPTGRTGPPVARSRARTTKNPRSAGGP